MKTFKLLLYILLGAIISSCSLNEYFFKRADKKYRYGEYEVAIEKFENLIGKDYKVGLANLKIAESYRLSNRVKDATPYYEKALENGIDSDSVHYYYATALKVNQRYKEARNVLENLMDRDKQTLNDEIERLAKIELENLYIIERLREKESYIRVKNLDLINTESAEYSPVYYKGELYFTSNRYNNKIYKATGTPFTDLYKAKTRGAIVDTTSITQLDGAINDPNTNEGTITFSPDGTTMIFAKGYTGKKKDGKETDLYASTFRRSEWSSPRKLRINDPEAWDSSPAFAPDGNSIVFASNRRGGYGGIDLYVATKNRRGRFSNPRNLGSEINTAGDEMFPFISDNGELYFASNGHPGLGGLDIFISRRESGKRVVENMGTPINSSSDDFGIFLFDPTKGFFTSNREGGSGNDDIYTFINNDPDLKIVNYFLVGIVYTLDENEEEQPLSNASVKIFSETDDQLLNEAVTGRDGAFRFRVYPEEEYYLVAEKEDYLTSRGNFSTIGKSIPKDELTKLVTNKTFRTKIQLDEIVIDKAIVLENIYYDLDEWYIRPDAAKELDKLVTILKDNPEIKIELSSHTDSRQTAAYNMDLSKKRAQSAVDYIVEQGIDPERITAKGYGESQLIVSDEEINNLPTEEARQEAHQRNRRTEFKILEYNKVEEPEEEEEEMLAEEDQEEELEIEEEEVQSEGVDLEDRIDWDN